jgi:hypothetical protein
MMLPAFAIAVLLAQAQPAEPAKAQPAKKVDPNAPVTMNGCLSRDYTDSKDASAYTFVDSVDGSRYHVKGKSVSKYSGMSVEVVGVIDTKKLRIIGGLYPSANIAGQAGAIDPGKAAVAAMPGGASTGTGNVDIPTLNVTRLSLGQGECRK